jgi:hypothetical protein
MAFQRSFDVKSVPMTTSQGGPFTFTMNAGQDIPLTSDRSNDPSQDFTTISTQNIMTNYGVTVHNGFASISIEAYHVCNFVFAPMQAKMKNLLKNFGSGGIIRVGGVSVDATGWNGHSNRVCPTTDLEDTAMLTPPMVWQLLNFADSIGWKVIWSVGLQLTPAAAADEASAVVGFANGMARGHKSPLLAITIGNEPENDLMNGNATYQQFRLIWEADARAIRARVPAVSFFGPDTCCSNNDQWFKNFVKDDGSQVRIATDHLYPLFSDDTHTPTIAQLLAPGIIQGQMDTIDSLRYTAAAQHLPLLMSETNSIANTPTPALGLSFGQSLWVADYLFRAQEHGVVALDFHGGVPGDATSPMHGDGQTLNVQATFYGMLFFEQAVAAGGHTVAVSASGGGGLNVVAHAIRGRDGKLYVAVINKGGPVATVRINSERLVPQRAQALRLLAPAVYAQTGFQLGGAAVNTNGVWSARQVEAVPIFKNIASLIVPGYSAVLVTFQSAS